MQPFQTYAPLVARLLLAALFLPAGLSKTADVAGLAGYIQSGGLPGFLAWPTIVFEILLGLSMILGFQARIMALLGAGFCVATALLYHLQPGDAMQMQALFKNLGVAAGFLMVFAHGPGRPALDKA
jgi:putative oxidoreductase